MPVGPLVSLGWGAVKTSPYPKWLAVKDVRVPVATSKAKNMPDIHAFARKHIAYKAEAGDVWQKPLDTLAIGAGDCEDICLVERALLLNAGYKDEDIELMIVWDRVTRQWHALLWVKEHYLDNRTDKVLHVSQFKDYQPVMGHRAGHSYIYGRIV